MNIPAPWIPHGRVTPHVFHKGRKSLGPIGSTGGLHIYLHERLMFMGSIGKCRHIYIYI